MERRWQNLIKETEKEAKSKEKKEHLNREMKNGIRKLNEEDRKSSKGIRK